MAAKMNLELTQLASNLLSTLATLASIVAPIALAITRGNPFWLAMFLTWPVTMFLMGAVRHANAPLWMPGVALFVLFSVTAIPSWYWFISLALVLAYHLEFNELPVKAMRVEQAWKESN